MRAQTGIVVLIALVGCHHGAGHPPAGGNNGTPPTDTPSPPAGVGAPAPSGPQPGVVSFVQVTSDRVDDVSSLEAWRRAFIHDGMSDADKAQAVWRSVVAFRHQDEPPREFLEDSGHVHDPIKLFNVYGYSQCDCASAAVAALGRAAGLTVRGRSLTDHSVPEVSFAGAWHMLDGAYVAQFPKPDGSPASVDELVANVSDWLGAHTGFDGSQSALAAYAVNPGWRTGPSLLAASPYFSPDGLLPTRLPGWTTMMMDYDWPSPEIEFGFTLGYRVNVQLRAGERLVRNWSNQGHHINEDLGLACDTLTEVPGGAGPMGYSTAYGDLAPGRVGNGTHEYEVPLANGQYRDGALLVDNLADAAAGDSGPHVRVGDASRPGVLVERMVSSYVALGGALDLVAQVPDGGAVAISFSRNHGVDWTPIATVRSSGATTIDLSPWVRRQYDYRLRFVLTGAGTGLDRLHVVDTIQYSQRALPALAVGDNLIDVALGPNEGTITLAASLDPTETHNRVFGEYHPIVDGVADVPLHPTGATGSITFPVATPGPMTRLRFGMFYRARSAGDAWQYQVSFDGGATFHTVASAAGPTAGDEKFVSDEDIPAGVSSALVRFVGAQSDTLDLFSFRIDADYSEPKGGVAPIAVTYTWQENGVARSDTHVIAQSNQQYGIHCDNPPQLGALIVERAPGP